MIALIPVTLVILFLVLKYFNSPKKCEKSKFKELCEIPCPGGLPLIGNMKELFWIHYDIWTTTRKRALDYYPIYRLKQLNKNIVFLLHPEDIKIILNDTKGCKKGPFYDPFRKLTGNGLIVNNGTSWARRRKVLTKCFHSSILENYLDIFSKEINYLVSDLYEKLGQFVDITSLVENMAFRITNEFILGNKSTSTAKESRDYIDAMTTVTEITLFKVSKPHLNLFWPFLKVKKEEDKALEKMDRYISKAIQENSNDREGRGYHNLLDLLLSAPHLFDETAVRNEIDTFIFGGQDTTATALSFMLMTLANYPEHQESIYQELKRTLCEDKKLTYSDLTSMEYLDRFVKECLRIHPPAIVIERILTEEVITKTGYRLPVGTIILLPILDIHRNPNLYPNPDKFDPDRFLPDYVVKRHPFAYIPFSAGPRNCIAQKYAQFHLKASICGIVQNFKLEPGTIIENIEYCPDLMLKVKGGIKVKFTKRGSD